MQITGVVGSFDWGYHRVATVRRWTITHARGAGWALEAEEVADLRRITLDHGLRAGQLTFEVLHARGTWHWPVRELLLTGASCTAVLGPKNKE